jgi:hypothetical protein
LLGTVIQGYGAYHTVTTSSTWHTWRKAHYCSACARVLAI